MKKFLTLALMTVAAITMQAQNIQLHYDFGRNIYPDEEAGRQKVTITLEQFKADKWGSWFYFVDLDMSRKFFRSAYTEISLQHAALLGGGCISKKTNFSKTWSVQLMYKRYFKSYDYTSAYHRFQLTGVWGLNFANKKCTFSGFIDFWRGENWRAGHEGHGMLVILTEPQFWYNVTPNLSFGSEIEISNNFIYNTYNDKSFFINPTIAAKWNF